MVSLFSGPVLVDLDETLYLRSSTEDFLDGARPALAALLVLRALDVLKPWRLTGGAATRDVWRVALIGALFPWIWWSWRRRAPALARAHVNAPLRDALVARGQTYWVVTDGFRPIVEPLCGAMELGDARVVACALSAAERRRGKRARAEDALGAAAVGRSLVVTDSESDRPLLDACAAPLLATWPNAHYRRALRHVYVPGQYIALVKHPGERFFLHGILLDDFAYWLLATLAVAPAPPLHVPALGALALSFWAIYERGYADNDRAASRFESDPALTEAFFSAGVPTPAVQPWLWAAAAGAAGVALLRYPALPRVTDLLAWAAVLAATAGLYFVYNRVDKQTRVWLYLGLQIARAASIAVLVPLVPVGAMALAAHALARWIPYTVYRSGLKGWPKMPVALARLLAFCALVSLLAASGAELGTADRWTFAATAAFCAWRARHDLRAVAANVRWLPRTAKEE